MGSRFPSHQLSNGLYVSGRPEQPKERHVPISSTAMPYTGGDIKKSGELGKMFDVHMESSKSRKSGPITNMPARTGSMGGALSHSGPLGTGGIARTSHSSGLVSSSIGMVSGPSSSTGGSNKQRSNSGPLNKYGDPIKKISGFQSVGVAQMARQNSGPLAPILPTTGLITSGPITSGPLNASGAPRKVSGPLDSVGSAKLHSNSFVQNQAITRVNDEEYSFGRSFPKQIFWSVVLLFLMGFIAGVFILVAVRNGVLLIVVMTLFGTMAAVFIWNAYWGKRAIISFITEYPDAELRTAKIGQYVKISGVVTCGNVPLESSFQKVPRCVYTSTSLYEYRSWNSKGVHPTQCRFTWEQKFIERHAVDFYISDFQSGLRALVKAGYGARVTPCVDDSVVINIDGDSKVTSPELLKWFRNRNISSDNCIMRLKEGCIKEGSTVNVMGVVQRNDNVLMIVPPSEPLSTGCQWSKCFLPATIEGIVLRCEDTSKIDVIPV